MPPRVAKLDIKDFVVTYIVYTLRRYHKSQTVCAAVQYPNAIAWFQFRNRATDTQPVQLPDICKVYTTSVVLVFVIGILTAFFFVKTIRLEFFSPYAKSQGTPTASYR